MSAARPSPGDAAVGDAEFVARLRRIVELAGGIAPLSRKSQLSRGVIHKYLNGESEPSRPRLVALAQAAGMTVEWLATGNDDARILSSATVAASDPVSGPPADNEPSALPELSQQQLRKLVEKHIQDMFPADGRGRRNLIKEAYEVVRKKTGTEDRLIMLGIFLHGLSLGGDCSFHDFLIPPVDLRLLGQRTPLFHIWQWRYARKTAPTPQELSPEERANFQSWQEGLHTFSVGELLDGTWEGDCPEGFRHLYFEWRGGQSYVVHQMALSGNFGSDIPRNGLWGIHNHNLAFAILDPDHKRKQTLYMVSESATDRFYAVVFNGNKTSPDGILIFSHTRGCPDRPTDIETDPLDRQQAG